uniref:HSF-type DNA-binding domain-containing protein n=1 Tax=Hyaloperonospora arabidopsidis (strain Emoy2) TaxID=559515 RepID=M4B9J2_HYAAE
MLPKYFKHSKYTSFQRQLNYFNFRKWTKSKALVCTFSNPFFQRDQPALAWRIVRKRPENIRSSSTAAKTKKAIAIKVPSGDASSPGSFPSPTDAYSIANELALFSEVSFHEPLIGGHDEQSLDWVDVLYSSLQSPLLMDNATGPICRDYPFECAEL